MAYVAKQLPYWVDQLSDVPRIVLSSDGFYAREAKFYEIESPYHGYFDSTVAGGNPRGISIHWPFAPFKIRWNGRKCFSDIENRPTLYLTGESYYGEWQGVSRGLSLIIPDEVAEQTLQTRLPKTSSGQLTEFASRIEHLLSVLRLDVSAGSPAGPTLGEVAIVEILNLLFPDDEARKALECRNVPSSKVRRACEIIEAHLSSRISLIELATSVDMSARQLTRAFRAATGYAPHEYVIHRRVARARDLIRQSRLSMAEVAERVGFASHPHMTATFRKVLGVVPSHFCNK